MLDRVALVKRFAVSVAGLALVAVGCALMVLPGPGILLVVAGLAILATEYVWARRLLSGARDRAEQAQRAAVASPWRTAGSILFGVASVVVGLLMIVVEDVPWPVLDATLDGFWGPITGSIVIVTGLVLLTTTLITLRTARATSGS